LTLPPEVAGSLKVKAGDEVEYVANGDGVLIRKAKKG